MKKVTKRLLVACVAALSVGACQDSITVETPPPPPPPPAVDATVTIQGLRTIPGNNPVNPTNVMGDINVVLNIEEGDNEVTQIDLLLDGDPIGCTAISTNQVPGEGVRLSQAAADVVECFFNTDDTAGECVGEQLDAAFSDGEHTLSARVTLGDGTTRTADNAQQITLNNGDFIALAHVPGITVISGGVNYYGGPLDTDGDGEDDNLNQIAACPVAFGGEVIDQLSLIASTGGPQAVDLGNGPGAAVTLNPPFIVDIDPDDNVGVEDDVVTNGLMSGHTFQLTGTILDETGLDVTAQFNASPLQFIFLDYTAPVVDPATAEITVDGNAVLGGEYFSAGDLDVTGVTDMGVGFTTGTGATFDVGACDDADNVDEDASTDFVALFADVVSIDDITEDDPILDADTNGEDCYVGEVTTLTDDLFNATDLTAQETINTGGAGAATPTFHGKDATEPVIDELQPDPADGSVILNDVAVMFDAADPDLESGDPGSGVDNAACTVAADGVTCTNITAEDEDEETYEVFEPTAGSFSVDIADLGGAGSAGALADGPHTITVVVPDLATAPNPATADIAFDLDTSAPSFGALNPVPGGSAGTAATSIIQSIGGTITDAHDIVMATISVFADGTDAVGTGGNGVCDAGTDYLLDDGAGEIDVNQVDISGTTDVSFNESFEIFEPSAASVTVTYCFILEAEDGAVDKTGAANPNQSSLSTQADVTWN